MSIDADNSEPWYENYIKIRQSGPNWRAIPNDKMFDVKEYRLTVRVNADLRRRLAKTARKDGKRESEIVREALEARLARETPEETVYDAFKRLGLIGCIKDAPPDLSTNPKYFEGFGES